MNLLDFVNRNTDPEPWSEGDNIPWNEPEFSARMLKEHLSQEHDAASRRKFEIEKQVEWIHSRLLNEKPGRVLDLGCGPGLYTHSLARRGHTCTGIDYSPASVAYAIDQADRDDLPCTYLLEDVRQAEFGSGYDLVMMIFGEMNIFRPAHIRLILRKAHAALAEGGRLLLEAHSYAYIEHKGQKNGSWFSAHQSLFSDRPHLYLEENFWSPQTYTTTTRMWIVDAATSQVSRLAQTFQAYRQIEYSALLEGCGFEPPNFYPALGEEGDLPGGDLIALVAAKGSAAV